VWKEKLVAKLGEGFQVQTWQDSNSAMLFALKLEKFTMGAILMLVVLVATFSVSGTLMMTVFHKRAQISVLRAMGMDKLRVYALFLSQGLVIGLLGLAAGAAIGIGFCKVLEVSRFLKLPNGMYYQDVLPVKMIPAAYVVIGLCSLLLVVLAAVYPSALAARQHPSSGLRTDF
jgi:lipoprotein-releasing system permease protein